MNTCSTESRCTRHAIASRYCQTHKFHPASPSLETRGVVLWASSRAHLESTLSDAGVDKRNEANQDQGLHDAKHAQASASPTKLTSRLSFESDGFSREDVSGDSSYQGQAFEDQRRTARGRATDTQTTTT